MRVIALVGVTVVAATASSCGGSGSSSAHPTSATSSTSIDPQAAQKSAVLAAWREYWTVYLDMGTKGTPFDPRLKDVATGKALNNSIAALDYRSRSGQVYRGTYDLNPTLVSLTGDSASVRDCSFDRTDIFNTRTSQVVQKADPNRSLETGTLTFDGGRWKVATIANGGPCTE
jgi:hypothetical protein